MYIKQNTRISKFKKTSTFILIYAMKFGVFFYCKACKSNDLNLQDSYFKTKNNNDIRDIQQIVTQSATDISRNTDDINTLKKIINQDANDHTIDKIVENITDLNNKINAQNAYITNFNEKEKNKDNEILKLNEVLIKLKKHLDDKDLMLTQLTNKVNDPQQGLSALYNRTHKAVNILYNNINNKNNDLMKKIKTLKKTNDQLLSIIKKLLAINNLITLNQEEKDLLTNS